LQIFHSLPVIPLQRTLRLTQNRWLSVDEIGTSLGVKRDTVYKWIREKAIPAHEWVVVGSLRKIRSMPGLRLVVRQTAQEGFGRMKIVDKIISLLGDDLKASIHPKAKLGVESAIEFEHTSESAIDPEDVIAWLVTQPNANGTLYLENVVRQYMGALRAAPAKLQIPVVFDVRSVFTCHTPDELNAYWDIFRAAPNYKQVNSSTSGMFSAGMGCLLRYLDYLSSTEDTVFCQAPTPQSVIDVWNDNIKRNIKRSFQTWLIRVANYSPRTAQIYASAVSRTVRSYRQIAETASSSSDTQAKAVQRFIALLAGDSDFVEANKRGHNLLSAALSAFERFIASESIDTISEETKIITSRKAKPHESVNVGLDSLLLEQLTDVLSSHFANGYRLNSPIEMARFRIFAAEDLGKELTLTDEELKSYITACGTIFEGKVYAVFTQAKERIRGLSDDYFADDAQAIFFAEFYAKNENWLFEASVVSEDMLICILRSLFPKLSFTQSYFGYTEASVITTLEGEILRVWGDDVLLTYGQLAERLQYIPLERIKSILGQNAEFIWNNVETFTHVSRIKITDEERKVIREAAMRGCKARGYAVITDLPFGEIEERNCELSITAVHNAVYRICLSDKFDKKGKIVARKGAVIDALTIMKKYCRTIGKCSLGDLLTYEKELTGEVHRWISMEAGNTVLIRIDKDTYVADRYVHFNTDIIDKTIGLFVKGDYLPLKSFTTFGAFSDCGQTWNLFLLESYCRRFSRKFRFDTSSVNSRNAGAVIRKSCSMDYTEIMTDAVANADLPLKDTAVAKFLFEGGYTGRSTTAKVNEIIDKAKVIRENRD
jgi:excisionase family DNA binding protein